MHGTKIWVKGANALILVHLILKHLRIDSGYVSVCVAIREGRQIPNVILTALFKRLFVITI